MSQIEEDARKFLPILVALTPLLLKVDNQVIHDERGYGIKLDGFYKDGAITVRPGLSDGIMGTPIATVDGRYEELLEIYKGENLFEEIVRLQASRFRYWSEVKPDDFKTIDNRWLPFLEEAGLVEKVVTTTYKVR